MKRVSAVLPQKTLSSCVTCVGKGLHSGEPVTLKLLPAPEGTGIVFCRTDLHQKIPARYDFVTDTRLSTTISDNKADVRTIEHLMAAFMGCGIDNAFVEIDHVEVPILDGSSKDFVNMIIKAGVKEQTGLKPCLEVLKTVTVRKSDGVFAKMEPLSFSDAAGLHISLEISFDVKPIGTQQFNFFLDPKASHAAFLTEIAPARTFTLARDVEQLKKMGLAKGGSLENAIVVSSEKILNPEGLRLANEFVRHKILDVLGDVSLVGSFLFGKFSARCTGHELNNILVRTLLADGANVAQIKEDGFLGFVA